MGKNSIKTDENTTPAAPASQEPVFFLAQLQSNCNPLFGVSPSTFIGATAALNKTEQYTKQKIDTCIKDWLKTPIPINTKKGGN